MFTLACALSIGFSAPPTPLLPPSIAAARTAVRGGSPLAQDVETDRRVELEAEGGDLPISWAMTRSGYKYVDDTVGDGPIPRELETVQVHYTVTLLSSGTTLGSSRGRAPLTFALGKHDVPIWDEALVGMRVGGKRRMLIPPSAIPDSQLDKVPGENRVLRFDYELLGTLDASSPAAKIAQALPPGQRVELVRSVFIGLWLASFVPYFLPTEMQPAVYHDGVPPEQIRERQLNRMNAAYLGTNVDLNGLFP